MDRALCVSGWGPGARPHVGEALRGFLWSSSQGGGELHPEFPPCSVLSWLVEGPDCTGVLLLSSDVFGLHEVSISGFILGHLQWPQVPKCFGQILSLKSYLKCKAIWD